jgi:hypothetical protein
MFAGCRFGVCFLAMGVLFLVPMQGAQLEVGGGKIEVVLEEGEPPQAPIMDWITTAARAVTSYYGHFRSSI